MTFPQFSKSPANSKKLAILVVIAIAVIAAISYFTRSKPIPVVLQKVERGNVEASVSNTRAGTVKACRRAKMSPPAGGQISRLLVKKGERVRKGQVLLELWDEDLQKDWRLSTFVLPAGTRIFDTDCRR